MATVPGEHRSFHAWLTSLEGYEGQVASLRFYPPRRAQHEDAPPGWAQAFGKLGFEPYTHQAQALRLLDEGNNVVLATPTASGKTLAYAVPALGGEPGQATTLYLAPTKALAHDQLLKLQEMALTLDSGHIVAAYDGDTPSSQRAGLREGAHVLLTNPDMLHFGILPFHDRWGRFLSRLSLVVLDELHTYRGVMGTHVANIVRRLLRVARQYGARPRLIAASATVGNPVELAEEVTGEPFVAVEGDGAAAPPREFIFWEPPLLQGSDGRRRSTNSEAAWLAANFVRAGLRSIFFCNSRKSAELLRRYATGQLDGADAPRLQTYRAGYTAEDRQLLERGFRSGDITVLAATSALELGVDVGDVDAVVMVGYPGSHMALWQRVGRAGRSGARALAILIPGNDPLDEYYLHHPELITEGEPEDAVADPFNTEIHPLHLECAAAELPLSTGEPLVAPWFDPRSRPHLYPCGDAWCHAGRYPHRHVRIRGAHGGRVRLVDGDGTTLGDSDLAAAMRDLHRGAVYLHQGETYLVAELDLERRKATLLPHIEEYYTQARSETDIEVLEVEERLGRVKVGRVRVTTTVSGYVLKRYVTEAVLDERLLDLPPLSYVTQALWFEVDDVRGAVDPALLPSAMHALEHTMIGLLPAFVLCERADVGGVSYPFYPATGSPLIFVYDGYPGGVGYSRGGAARFRRWLEATREHLRQCPCKAGCPRCILSPKCGNGNQYLDKGAALDLAAALLTATPERPAGVRA